MLPDPVKNLHGGLTPDEKEVNRVFQFYRARCEHAFGWMKSFSILNDRYRSHDLQMLDQAFTIIANLRNIILAVRIAYAPAVDPSE